MSSIVQNQHRAYLAQAEDACRVFASRLAALAPAEQAALLARAAKDAGCPIDMVMRTEEKSDALDAALILDGDLRPGLTGNWAWRIGSGCEFQIHVTQGDQHE